MISFYCFINVCQVRLGIVQKLPDLFTARHRFHINSRDFPAGLEQEKQSEIDAGTQQDADNQIPMEK